MSVTKSPLPKREDETKVAQYQEDDECVGFPQTFQLTALTLEGKEVPMGATVTRMKPKSEVFVDDVDEDGLLYKTGIRSGDILLKVNFVEITPVDLASVVEAISKLDVFYFILRRETFGALGGSKSHVKMDYLHIAFAFGNVTGLCGTEENHGETVDIKFNYAYFGVGKDKKVYTGVLSFQPFPVYVRVSDKPTTVNIRVDASGKEDYRYMNINHKSGRMEFTKANATLYIYRYINDHLGKSAAVISPDQEMCIRTNQENELVVRKKGKLEKEYVTLDGRFFIEETADTGLVKYKSSVNPDNYITVDTNTWEGVMRTKGLQEMSLV